MEPIQSQFFFGPKLCVTVLSFAHIEVEIPYQLEILSKTLLTFYSQRLVLCTTATTFSQTSNMYFAVGLPKIYVFEYNAIIV